MSQIICISMLTQTTFFAQLSSCCFYVPYSCQCQYLLKCNIYNYCNIWPLWGVWGCQVGVVPLMEKHVHVIALWNNPPTLVPTWHPALTCDAKYLQHAQQPTSSKHLTGGLNQVKGSQWLWLPHPACKDCLVGWRKSSLDSMAKKAE